MTWLILIGLALWGWLLWSKRPQAFDGTGKIAAYRALSKAECIREPKA